MARIKLGGCKHRYLEAWGDVDGHHDRWTCLACFRRLTTDHTMINQRGPILKAADAWDGICQHPADYLKPIDTPGSSMYRALCRKCGCIVEHPPGIGKWTPVLFYDYLIEEEPEL